MDRSGRVLGHHAGVMNFTVGQRKGLGVSARGRLHVLQIRPEDKTVVVGASDELHQSGLLARGAVWGCGTEPVEPVRARVQIRYRDPGTWATVTPLPDHGVQVRFDTPVRAVAPGQATVFRQGDEVLGGAFIAEGLP